MKLLRKEEVIIRPSYDGVHIVASFYGHEGYRVWSKYHLSDFPNYLASINDCKRFGINF